MGLGRQARPQEERREGQAGEQQDMAAHGDEQGGVAGALDGE
jgi:hypothetical protein